jgi:hypothetical protein
MTEAERFRKEAEECLRQAEYAVIPMPAELRGTSGYWTGWWTVTRNGVPVRHYPPKDRDFAERFATDPTYRQQLTNKKEDV